MSEKFPNQMNPPTGGIYHSVFHLRTSGRDSGTAFSIQVGTKIFLVTAAHLVLEGRDEIEIYFDAIWHKFLSKQRHFDSRKDLAIFDFPTELMSPPSYIEVSSSDSYFVGQHAFFLGYPLGDFSLVESYGAGKRPLPFVKWGGIAMIGFGKSKSELILDAYNLDGFSGGPILVNMSDGKQVLVGVVTNTREISRPVETLAGVPASTGMFVFQNAGLLVAVSVDGIKDAIATF